MAQNNDFNGIWYSCYWYPSNDHKGEDPSEYYVNVHQKGNQLVIESLPNSTGSYILVRLSVDGDIATGTWHEQTAPKGPFKGMVYSGALQLLVSKDKTTMAGKWVGVGHDYGRGKPQIYDGRWEITRAGKNAAKEAGKQKAAD